MHEDRPSLKARAWQLPPTVALQNHHDTPDVEQCLQLLTTGQKRHEGMQAGESQSQLARERPASIPSQSARRPPSPFPTTCSLRSSSTRRIRTITHAPAGRVTTLCYTPPPPHCSLAALVSSTHSPAAVGQGREQHANPEFSTQQSTCLGAIARPLHSVSLQGAL